MEHSEIEHQLKKFEIIMNRFYREESVERTVAMANTAALEFRNWLSAQQAHPPDAEYI